MLPFSIMPFHTPAKLSIHLFALVAFPARVCAFGFLKHLQCLLKLFGFSIAGLYAEIQCQVVQSRRSLTGTQLVHIDHTPEAVDSQIILLCVPCSSPVSEPSVDIGRIRKRYSFSNRSSTGLVSCPPLKACQSIPTPDAVGSNRQSFLTFDPSGCVVIYCHVTVRAARVRRRERGGYPRSAIQPPFRAHPILFVVRFLRPRPKESSYRVEKSCQQKTRVEQWLISRLKNLFVPLPIVASTP
jgi:hypothetical protein